jgi:1-acyl-sn-glycerol-3-phosphate acyltransferase
MGKKFGHFVLNLFGWKTTGDIPPEIKKCIVIVAPHTSNWDFFVGFFGYMTIGIKAKYLIKKEAFFFPLGPIVKVLGGIPVDRSKSTNIVQQVGEMFRNEKELLITITPEGTRSLVNNWKKGFYYIAEHANVPIVLGILDYGKKLVGIGPVFHLSGNYEKDLREIEAFYMNSVARHPEKFNLSPQNRKKMS